MGWTYWLWLGAAIVNFLMIGRNFVTIKSLRRIEQRWRGMEAESLGAGGMLMLSTLVTLARSGQHADDHVLGWLDKVIEDRVAAAELLRHQA